MLNKSFFLVIFSIITFQIIFSFYYSSEIINQNNLLNKNQITLQILRLKNQNLEKKLAVLSSLTTIEINTNQKKYTNLPEALNLKN